MLYYYTDILNGNMLIALLYIQIASLETGVTRKGKVMNDTRKVAAWIVFLTQTAATLWLSQRLELDIFSQMVLLPILLISSLVLLTLQLPDD